MLTPLDTIYRGPPTPQLEKAWEELWFCELKLIPTGMLKLTLKLDGGVRITEDKLALLNRTADLGNGRHLKPVEDEKGGYHALLEVFHQLHCLVRDMPLVIENSCIADLLESHSTVHLARLVSAA